MRGRPRVGVAQNRCAASLDEKPKRGAACCGCTLSLAAPSLSRAERGWRQRGAWGGSHPDGRVGSRRCDRVPDGNNRKSGAWLTGGGGGGGGGRLQVCAWAWGSSVSGPGRWVVLCLCLVWFVLCPVPVCGLSVSGWGVGCVSLVPPWVWRLSVVLCWVWLSVSVPGSVEYRHSFSPRSQNIKIVAMCLVTNCCCCISLRIGCKIIAILFLAHTIFEVVDYSIGAANADDNYVTYDAPNGTVVTEKLSSKATNVGVNVALAVLSVIKVATVCFLLCGACRESAFLIRLFLLTFPILGCIILLFTLVLAILNFAGYHIVVGGRSVVAVTHGSVVMGVIFSDRLHRGCSRRRASRQPFNGRALRCSRRREGGAGWLGPVPWFRWPQPGRRRAGRASIGGLPPSKPSQPHQAASVDRARSSRAQALLPQPPLPSAAPARPPARAPRRAPSPAPPAPAPAPPQHAPQHAPDLLPHLTLRCRWPRANSAPERCYLTLTCTSPAPHRRRPGARAAPPQHPPTCYLTSPPARRTAGPARPCAQRPTSPRHKHLRRLLPPRPGLSPAPALASPAPPGLALPPSHRINSTPAPIRSSPAHPAFPPPPTPTPPHFTNLTPPDSSAPPTTTSLFSLRQPKLGKHGKFSPPEPPEFLQIVKLPFHCTVKSVDAKLNLQRACVVRGVNVTRGQRAAAGGGAGRAHPPSPSILQREREREIA
ncbi:Protein of unknown function [Gryllus bimaculatus]|nr:Protein of unknown function [Gryllus bimaculatus]